MSNKGAVSFHNFNYVCIPLYNDYPRMFAIEFAKSLQSLARKGDSELMTLFEASFEGISFNEETFDEKYFLDNVKDYVNELSSNSKSV